jgi:hypothetical protein
MSVHRIVDLTLLSMGRVATEAPGDVRLGRRRRREPPVPAAVGGPRRARFRDERRRPRQPSRGVRRRQQGPPPAAKDPGLPVPENAGSVACAGQPVTELSLPQAERFPGHFSTHAIPGDVRAAVVGRAPGLPPGAAAAVTGALVPRPQRQPLGMTSLSQLLSVLARRRRVMTCLVHARATCCTNRRCGVRMLSCTGFVFPTRNEDGVLMGSHGKSGLGSLAVLVRAAYPTVSVRIRIREINTQKSDRGRGEIRFLAWRAELVVA